MNSENTDPNFNFDNIKNSEMDLPNQKQNFLISIGLIVGRSLFPLLVVIALIGTTFWGPWVSLILVFCGIGILQGTKVF
jgi:hypothetical protein